MSVFLSFFCKHNTFRFVLPICPNMTEKETEQGSMLTKEKRTEVVDGFICVLFFATNRNFTSSTMVFGQLYLFLRSLGCKFVSGSIILTFVCPYSFFLILFQLHDIRMTILNFYFSQSSATHY